jgi:hypothetical protein
MSGSSTPGTSRRGYGNIYTPHAGSMVIQVQREGGLQSRTIVLSPRQVQLLRFFLSRSGRVLGVIVAVAAIGLAVEASRVPVLTRRLASFEHTATRLDTLERSLAELQKRYDQVQRMLGAAPARPGDALTPVGDSIRRPVARRARAAPTAGVPADQGTATDSSTSGAGTGGGSAAAGSASGAETDSSSKSAGHKPAAPMD